MSALRFDGVGLRYPGGARALTDVRLDIPAGQICVLLGASGAGKSSLLATINGLAIPTEGRVLVDGEPLTPRRLRLLRPRIGTIHQQFALTARASVATNMIAGAAAVLPSWRILTGCWPAHHRARACALLDEVGLGLELLPRRVEQLSGGQQQRVGIARAFMLDPAIILADEPVASLDPIRAAEVLALLRGQARARGATVVCSLHQLDLARGFADRIVALRAGRVMFDGPPPLLDRRDVDAIYATHGVEAAA